MKTKMMALSALAMIVSGGAMAGGIQRDEWVNQYSIIDQTAIHVPCLNDAYLEGTETVHGWYQEFYSPVTGAYHVMLQMRSEVILHDQAGHTWLGEGRMRWVGDLWSGDSGVYTAHFIFKPVDSDGQMWTMENRGKLTLNAKGEVVVDRPLATEWEDVSSCLPAK